MRSYHIVLSTKRRITIAHGSKRNLASLSYIAMRDNNSACKLYVTLGAKLCDMQSEIALIFFIGQ